MRSRIRRHLGALLGETPPRHIAVKAIAAAGVPVPAVPSEFNARQYGILLLQVAASIEHALMIEYLYAAHSLGGSQVPPSRMAEVSRWREIILGIAKEEMGHLMTIQNVLRCVGGPLSLDREDYPWDSDFYPFPFRLEPLTRQSLAKYVYSESPSPEDFTGPEAEEIHALALLGSGKGTVHRVGALYEKLEALFDPDAKLIPDSVFREETYPFQANWDEWGRGYKDGARGGAMGGAMPRTPNLLVLPVTARTDVLSALRQVATQGEANPTADDSQPSHFARFLRIFREFPRDGSWSPARDVAVNPVVNQDGSLAEGHEGTPMTDPEAVNWAQLLNVRYRLLLVNLLHTFEYPSNLSEDSQFTPRGLLIHSTFGEMYNLRALTEILMETPLSSGSKQFAGPPFQMPYTMSLPVDGIDKWNVHLDLLETSRELIGELEYDGHKHGAYLRALKEADSQVFNSIQSICGNLRKSTATQTV